MITIVTINYNNKTGLSKTLESIQYLVDKKNTFELVVIDGDSNDGSLDIIDKYNYLIDYSISEPDDGIFDAMNKGVNIASYDWIIFMNSGDVFSSNFTLSSIPKKYFNSDYNLIFGNKIEDGISIKPQCTKLLEYGVIHACHQAMFIRKKFDYDLKYKVYGDYELVSRLYAIDKDKLKYIDIDICEREEGGVSREVSSRKRYEKYLAVYEIFGFTKLVKSLFYRLFN